VIPGINHPPARWAAGGWVIPEPPATRPAGGWLIPEITQPPAARPTSWMIPGINQPPTVRPAGGNHLATSRPPGSLLVDSQNQKKNER